VKRKHTEEKVEGEVTLRVGHFKGIQTGGSPKGRSELRNQEGGPKNFHRERRLEKGKRAQKNLIFHLSRTENTDTAMRGNANMSKKRLDILFPPQS